MADTDEVGVPDYWKRVRPHMMREGVGGHAVLFERRDGDDVLEVGVFPDSLTDGWVRAVLVGPRGGQYGVMSGIKVAKAREWARKQRELVYQVERACNILEHGSPGPRRPAEADENA